MSGFDASWLDLREPVDARARSRALADRLAAVLQAAQPAAATDTAAMPATPADAAAADALEAPQRGTSLAVTDLGSGTGANLRWLAPVLGGAQHWRLVDNDPALLAAQQGRLAGFAREHGLRFERVVEPAAGRGVLRLGGSALALDVDTVLLDLSAQLGSLALPAHGLVTASALLDLVSDAWLQQLTASIAAARAVACFALTYDGRIELAPALPDDTLLRGLVNAHQRGDKGFGPALGPTAAAAAAARLTQLGYRVYGERSDWRLDAGDGELAHALIKGWLLAARELEPAAGSRLDAWARIRFGQLERGELAIVVGHEDLLALPA